MTPCPTCRTQVIAATVLFPRRPGRVPVITLDLEELPLDDGLVILLGHERGQTLGMILDTPRPRPGSILGRSLAAASHAHRMHVCDRVPLPVKARAVAS